MLGSRGLLSALAGGRAQVRQPTAVPLLAGNQFARGGRASPELGRPFRAQEARGRLVVVRPRRENIAVMRIASSGRSEKVREADGNHDGCEITR
jgi:hypothetical protein